VAGLAKRSPTGYIAQATTAPDIMKLEKPFSIRLPLEQVQWLDSFVKPGTSRGAVIRTLVAQAMQQHKSR
jgi:hypothetical protein